MDSQRPRPRPLPVQVFLAMDELERQRLPLGADLQQPPPLANFVEFHNWCRYVHACRQWSNIKEALREAEIQEIRRQAREMAAMARADDLMNFPR